MSAAELARTAAVTRQTMHAAIVRLEAGGLVERHTVNRRVVLIRLTRAGRERLAAATKRVRAVERFALAGLSRDEERTVRGWLAGVAAQC